MTKPVTDPLQLNEYLWACLDQLDLEKLNHRTTLASAAFRYIVDCHQAFSLLTSKGLHGPTFALARTMFEGLQRGYWLYYCASDDKINNLNEIIADSTLCSSAQTITVTDRYLFSNNVIRDIETSEHFKQHQFLQHVKSFILNNKSEKNREAMNSYTHVGYLMLRDYISVNAIEPNFDREAIHEVLRSANCCACFAVLGAAEIAENGNLSEKVFFIYRDLS